MPKCLNARAPAGLQVSGLRGDNGELRSKLEDSKQQLQSNEQMIRWLNQQVRAGLGRGS